MQRTDEREEIIIDLADTSNSENQEKARRIYADFMAQNKDVTFIEKSKVYEHGNYKIKFAQNLIRTSDTTPGHNKFYVISEKDTDILGKGSFSKSRRIIASIDIDSNGVVTHEKVEGKAVRIRNTKSAQLVHQNKKSKYESSVAENEYQNAQPFTHLALQKPIHVQKEYPGKEKEKTTGTKGVVGEFTKSYSVMNELKGKDLATAASSYDGLMAMNPTTAMLVELLILPVLKAYDSEIAQKGYVHRDLKPNNITAILLSTKPTVHYLDFDTSVPIGTTGNKTVPGTPGYIAPETNNASYVESTSRDLYSLGVILMGAVNDNVDIGVYYKGKTSAQLFKENYDFVHAAGFFDPDKLLASLPDDAPGKTFFSYLDADELENDDGTIAYQRDMIKYYLTSMSSFDPANRPDLKTLIAEFENILQTLNNLNEAVVDDANEQAPTPAQTAPNEAAQEAAENKSSTSSIALAMTGGNDTKAAADLLTEASNHEKKDEASQTTPAPESDVAKHPASVKVETLVVDDDSRQNITPKQHM